MGLSYCGGGKSVHFCANSRYVAPLRSSNSRKTVLNFPLASLRTPKSDRLPGVSCAAASCVLNPDGEESSRLITREASRLWQGVSGMGLRSVTQGRFRA